MTPRDYLGNIPKVGDTIAIIVNTSTSHASLEKAIITKFEETKKLIKMFVESPEERYFLFRNYLILEDNKNNDQFIIINNHGK